MPPAAHRSTGADPCPPAVAAPRRPPSQHVELVGQLVDHQIEAVPIPVLLQLAPGQHQRPLRPGFAGVLLFNFAHQPELVLHLLPAHHRLGDQDDLVKAPIPVEPQVQNGQRRLQGQHRLLTGSERHPELGQGLASQQLLRQPDQGLLLLREKPCKMGTAARACCHSSAPGPLSSCRDAPPNTLRKRDQNTQTPLADQTVFTNRFGRSTYPCAR